MWRPLLFSILLIWGLLPGLVAAATLSTDMFPYPSGFEESIWVTRIDVAPDPAGFYAPSEHIIGYEINLRSQHRDGVNFTIKTDVWNMSGNMTKGLIFTTLKATVTDPQGDVIYYENRWMPHMGLRLWWNAMTGEMEAHRLGPLGNNTLFPEPTYINITTTTQGYLVIQTVDDLGYEALRETIIATPQTFGEMFRTGVGEAAGAIGGFVWAFILLVMPREWEAPFTEYMGFILNAMRWLAFLILNFWLLLMGAITMGMAHAIILTRRNRRSYRIMRMYQILVRDVRGFLDWFFSMVISIGSTFLSVLRLLYRG